MSDLPAWVEDMQKKGSSLSDCLELMKVMNDKEREERTAERDERNAQREMKRAEMDHEYKLKELAVREQEMSMASKHGLSSAPSQHQKLPKYEEGQDIDVFLRSFEKMAMLHNWYKDQWAIRLVPLLTGKALEAYSRLDNVDSANYEKIKEAILKRYELTSEAYREKLRSAKQRGDESFRDYQIKAIAINAGLQVVHEAAIKFDSDLPEFKTDGGAHIHPDRVMVTAPTIMWVKALDCLLGQMQSAGFPFDKVAGISGAGQQHGSVYWKDGARKVLNTLDKAKALHQQLQDCFSVPDSPIWMDASTTKQCKELENKVGGAMKLAEITGARGFERYTGNQIMKICQNNRQAYDKTERISLVSSFAATLFLGDYAPIDLSDGSGMNLLDINTKSWSSACLEASGPNLGDKLGEPVESRKVVGKISAYYVEKYNFSPTCNVVAFTGDNPASLAGMAPQVGDAIVSLGTSDTVFLWLAEQKAGLEGHIFVNPIDSSAYMALVCFKNGSLTREHIKDKSAGGSWDTFSKMLTDSTIGNNGNIGIYFDVMEIQPLAEGVYRYNQSNQKVDSFPAEVEVRAVIESQFMARRMYSEMRGMTIGSQTRVLATGGASNNKAILQVLSDVFNAPVYVTDVANSAALGSCYRAIHAICNKPFSEVVKGHQEPVCVARPNPEAKQIYDVLRQRYANLEKAIAAKS